MECEVFLVGYNPATDIGADFWSFWTDRGYDKKAWQLAYERHRASRPLKPGRTRRQTVSATRRMIQRVVDASGLPVLETNIFSTASDDVASSHDDNLRPFQFLLRTIQPRLIVAHGDDAQGALRSIDHTGEVWTERHFSRGFSYERADELGQKIRSFIKAKTS
ncbi:hypothetical protein [Paracoccus ravus]|uniref:hypothetical protein n=1 Tax=Paracoccus ravus TaxID=2447760 RepID=UPI0014301C5A|nr:hypothetical protein [Paracoccus ravus]